MVSYDFNDLETLAASFRSAGRFRDALRVYLFMADGDPSLDGGWLGERIGECYERLSDPDAARFWYGRAVEENPDACLKAAEARARLSAISLVDLCGPEPHGES